MKSYLIELVVQCKKTQTKRNINGIMSIDLSDDIDFVIKQAVGDEEEIISQTANLIPPKCEKCNSYNTAPTEITYYCKDCKTVSYN
jgi:hypothetical protein